MALSTLMEWGRATTNVFTTTLSGIGSASAQVTGSSRSGFALIGGDAVGGGVLLLGLVGVVAGAGFLWTRWRIASAVIAAVAGGLAFIVCVTSAVNISGTMKAITGPVSGDFTVGFGLVFAFVVAVVLAGLGITSFVLERASGRPSAGER